MLNGFRKIVTHVFQATAAAVATYFYPIPMLVINAPIIAGYCFEGLFTRLHLPDRYLLAIGFYESR